MNESFMSRIKTFMYKNKKYFLFVVLSIVFVLLYSDAAKNNMTYIRSR